MEIIRYFFSNFWHYLELLVLVAVIFNKVFLFSAEEKKEDKNDTGGGKNL